MTRRRTVRCCMNPEPRETSQPGISPAGVAPLAPMRGPGKHRTARAVAVVALLGSAACEPKAKRETPPLGPSASAMAAARAGSAARPPLPPVSASAPPLPRAEPPLRVIEELGDAGLALVSVGAAAEIGPAGPATATPDGVVLLTKDDRLLFARATAGKFSPVGEPAGALAALGRGPAVAGGRAYWVSRGRLVRAPLSGGAYEVLAEGARDGSRVAAQSHRNSTVAAYVTKPDAEGTARAKLWVEGGRSHDLTPDGAGASSVALAETHDGVLAVSIDGRSGMTPVHARRVRLSGRDATLAPDVVSWIAGPAQTFTEIFAGFDERGGWAFLPIERDATHFGLASIELGNDPAMDAPVEFLDYPNGLNLAPVAASTLCGRTFVALVRPKRADPGSPQELVLAEAGSGARTTVADALGFASVSLSSAPSGGTIAYVADRKTFAHPLSCRRAGAR
jgi:hypothetical protein